MASTSEANNVAKILLPGDVGIEHVSTGGVIQLRVGPGLRQDVHENKSQLLATKSGVLRHKQPHTYWLDHSQKRAVVAANENVIGIIVGKTGEHYAVDIGTHISATLPNLAFEGASKRNRPMLDIGDLVYAKVTQANKDMEPELQCVDSSGASQGLGPLADGYMFTCSTGLCRRLLSSDCYVLQALGKLLSFEIAVGFNGRVWVKSPNTQHTAIAANTIAASEYLTPKQIDAMLQDVWRIAK